MDGIDQAKRKPCGLEYWCPLVDEGRLFVESQELLFHLQRARLYQVANLVGRVWCKGHVAHQLVPDLRRCRAVCGQAARVFLDATGRPEAAMSAYLRAQLKEASKEQGRQASRLLQGAAF